MSYIDFFDINQCLLKFLVKLKFCVSDEIFMCLINLLINPCKMATPQEKTQCVSWFIKTNRMFRLSEYTELSMEEIHHHVLQFIDGTRIL